MYQGLPTFYLKPEAVGATLHPCSLHALQGDKTAAWS